MIKSDFGTIEVDGREPVIMAEFETILVVLRRVLREEKYNLVLQRASEEELSRMVKKYQETTKKNAWQKLSKLFLVKWRISNYGRKQQFRGTESQHCGQPVD